MPAPKLLAGLPKPVLFSLYGAIGGLLGAVLLGEPAWRLLKPPPPAAPAAQLAVSTSASVSVYPGTSNTFVVQIARAEFDGPVTVKFAGLPPETTIEPVTIPTRKTQTEATVVAGAAVAGPKSITATAEGGGASAATAFDLVVAPAPPVRSQVAVSIAPKLLVYRGGTCKIPVQVARAGFDRAVRLEFAPHIEGVTFRDFLVPAGKTEVEVTLAADSRTAPGTTTLTVTADAETGKVDVPASAHIELAVMEQPPRPVDIMFVLDCTGSMEPFIDGVKDGIRDFVKELSAKEIDGRLGLLAFRDRLYGQEPELLTFDEGNPFTTDTKLFAERVGRLRCIGNNTIPESSLDGTVEAAKQPFRDRATRVLLLITDAPPLIPDKTTRTMREAVDLLKEKKIDQLHVVIRKNDREMYSGLQSGASGKGKFFDLERVTSGGEKFATILPELSREIANTVAAKPVKAEVAPAAPPPVIPAGAVAQPTASAAPAAPAVKSLQSSEQSAAGTEGRRVLQSGVWTGAIAALVCLALLAGQHHYLRGSLPAAGGAAVGLLGGLAAGVAGGAAGQGLYLFAKGGPVVEVLFQVFGWALLGGLAGVGLSLFIPNMKWVHGLAGGVLGGAVGAVGFLTAAALANDVVGRLVGGLALGLCVGLMVAVVEAAFRRAWLEVRYGTRETITVNLGPEPVKIGGDSRVCTVWARGAAPLALRFFVRDGQVICDDPVMKREATVADGFAKEVGNVTVTVHTGTSAVPVAPTPPRPSTAPPLLRPVASPPAPKPLDLEPLDLEPASVAPPRPVPAVPPRPPVPTAMTKPVAAPRTTSTPTPSPREPDACPSCGRKNPGRPGNRYCMVCDQTY